jgi:concentrative nucleoside transporter, CNT family
VCHVGARISVTVKDATSRNRRIAYTRYVFVTKGKVSIPESDDKEANFLHAATNGSATGVQIVLLILGAVLAVISLYNAFEALVGFLFQMIDIYDTVNPPVNGQNQLVSMKLVLSYVFL